MNQEKLYIKAINMWGRIAQINMAIEECGELIVALAKNYRDMNGSTVNEVLDEMADVEIMIEQLKIMFNYMYSNDAVDKFEDIKRRKLERLEKRLE